MYRNHACKEKKKSCKKPKLENVYSDASGAHMHTQLTKKERKKKGVNVGTQQKHKKKNVCAIYFILI